MSGKEWERNLSHSDWSKGQYSKGQSSLCCGHRFRDEHLKQWAVSSLDRHELSAAEQEEGERGKPTSGFQ